MKKVATLLVGMLLGGGLMAALPVAAGTAEDDLVVDGNLYVLSETVTYDDLTIGYEGDLNVKSGTVELGHEGSSILSGAKAPEGNIKAKPGSLYLRTNGKFYVKESGTGKRGWVRH